MKRLMVWLGYVAYAAFILTVSVCISAYFFIYQVIFLASDTDTLGWFLLDCLIILGAFVYCIWFCFKNSLTPGERTQKGRIWRKFGRTLSILLPAMLFSAAFFCIILNI